MNSIALTELTHYLNNLLDIELFNDYAPNGLQVEGKPEIGKLVLGVTASKALISKAMTIKADAILVHHGYFWKGESPCVVGVKKNRLQSLLNNELSLLAYHLPLDAHRVYGNNKQLAILFGWEVVATKREGLIYVGKLQAPISPSQLKLTLKDKLKREPLHIHADKKNILKLAWCTGAGQDFIEEVAMLGVDAYISGEISERTVHMARELGIEYYAAGHHATERYGVQALGEHLTEMFSIECIFIDVENPV